MKNPFLKSLLAGLVAVLFASWSLQAADESQLIAVLQSNAGVPEKAAACQQLRIYGTAASVPALAKLLGEDRLGQAARYALEGMAFPEAGDALRDALGSTSGLLKAGIIDSLGWRHDATALPMLLPLLSDTDEAMVVAAAGALGRIGGAPAIKALERAWQDAGAGVQPAIGEALLQCAEARLKQADPAGAAAIYRELLEPATPAPVRLAAWRGAVAGDDRRAELLVEALDAADSKLQAAALSLVRELNDQNVIDALVQRWSDLPAEGQLAVLEARLAFGGEVAPIAAQAAQSPHVNVRVRAWEALANLGSVASLPAMARAAASGEDAERAAAREALARIRGDGVGDALLAGLQDAEPAERAELLRALGQRGDPSVARVLLDYARAEPAMVRLAAVESLTLLASPDTLDPLLRLAAAATDENDQGALLRALFALCQSSPDKPHTTREVNAVLSRLPTVQQCRVLPVLAELGTPDALKTLDTLARGTDSVAAKQAVRVLTQWPDATPSAYMLSVATTATDPALRTLALRGAITTAGLREDPAARLKLLRRALSLATQPTEKKLVLGQLGQIPTREALDLALASLNDPALVNEAALAAISAMEPQAKTDPALADAVATTVLAKCEIPAIVQRAWALRAKPAAAGAFIRDWLVSRPYRRAGAVGALTVFNIAFGPEKPGAEVKWYAGPVGDSVPLAAFFPGQDNCVAYLKAVITAPVATDALLLMGSDDGLKVWLNGAVVHSNNIDRGQVVDQDMAPIKLRAGDNELLMKVTQGGGGWSACARIVGTDGQPIPGLQVKSQTDAPPVSQAKAPPVQEVVAVPAKLPPQDAYRTLTLSDKFYAEGATAADINRDGKLDVVAGPFWFAGPDFTQRHEYRPAKEFDPNGYSDNFLTFCGNFNGDEWPDILCVPFPGAEGFWYANPTGKDGPWEQHLAHQNIGNESPVWGDVTGDGRPELLFCIDGQLGYAGPDPDQPDEPWRFHGVSTKEERYQRFTHGVGFGDLNGDGRNDVLESIGWWEQPADPQPGKPWIFHPFRFATDAAQMLVNDVDGDGLADVITAWHCHLYGLVWWRQVRRSGGEIDWEQHVIFSPTPDVSTPDFRPSQMHALELVDMNGDGLQDILTGKRFWAHGPTGDKEPDAPAVVFWLELRRDNSGTTFTPHLIHDNSGVGTQVAAADLNNDQQPDVVVANKKGIFVHRNERGR
ncbi:MAG: HEAT repeat domain-containing protein [Verrucomicrobiales bacterium]|nr:HEAT repeat domain-containing protein [Verrucomicrobiales bacterium]